MLDVKIGKINMIIIGLYRPPRPLVGAYQQSLEEELNHICTWASLEREAVTVIGDLTGADLGVVRVVRSNPLNWT